MGRGRAEPHAHPQHPCPSHLPVAASAVAAGGWREAQLSLSPRWRRTCPVTSVGQLCPGPGSSGREGSRAAHPCSAPFLVDVVGEAWILSRCCPHTSSLPPPALSTEHPSAGGLCSCLWPSLHLPGGLSRKRELRTCLPGAGVVTPGRSASWQGRSWGCQQGSGKPSQRAGGRAGHDQQGIPTLTQFLFLST